MYDIDDFIRRADDELAQYDAHQRRFEDLIRTNGQRRGELEERLLQTREAIGAAALSDPTPEAANALAERLKLPDLADAVRAWRRRRADNAARIAQIEDERLWQEREIRRGRLQHQIDEEQPLLDELSAERQRMEALDGLAELVHNGWGTDAYPRKGLLRFFQRAFLNDWRRSDDAIEALGVKDFGEIRERYLYLVEQSDALRQSQGRLHGELRAIDALEAERDTLLETERDAPRELQREAGTVLEQVASLRDGLADSLPDPDTARRGLVAAAGIAHQCEYLDATNQRIEGDLATLMERAGRLREEDRRYRSDRYRYRNKRFTDEQFGKRFGRTGRYSRLADRYDRTSHTLYVFDRYDRYDPVGDALWWDVITDGRLDGNYISEVAEWRQQHPGVVWEAPDAPDDGWDESS